MAFFKDNSAEYQQKLEEALEAALEAVGTQCEAHVVQNVTKDAYKHPVDWYHRTGGLKKFSHKVALDEKCVYVGTNTKYAIYWEYGTGQYADGGGRQGYWVFVPGGGGGGVGSGKVYTQQQAKQIMAMLQSKGIDAHMTNGIKPVHMLKRAVQDHTKEYKAIFEQYLKGVGTVGD